MALKISDSRSFKLEPMRKNRFLFQFSSIPGPSNNGKEEDLAFIAKSADVPAITFEKTSAKRIHETFNTAGMISWNDLNVVFNDFISPPSENNNAQTVPSAGDMLYNWSKMIYDPLTGQMGYKTSYSTSATEAQFDPQGKIIRAWNIFGIFPTSVNFGGTLSYEDAGATEISCTFTYDLAIKVGNTQSSEPEGEE